MAIIDEIIAKVNKLPPLSQSANSLIALGNANQISTKDITSVIEKDPFLASIVLKTANSSVYARSKETSSINEAIVTLGNRLVFETAMKYCFAGILKKPLKGYQGGANSLLKNSLCTAIGAKILSNKSIEKVSPDTAYTAGLLHNIGKIVLSEYLVGKVNDIISGVNTGKFKNFIDAEKEKLGITHSEVGVEIASSWKLPTAVQQSIAYYSKPSKADEEFQPLVYVVHLASIISMMIGAHTDADSMIYSMDEKSLDFFNLSENEFEIIIMDISNEYDITLALMSSEEDKK